GAAHRDQWYKPPASKMPTPPATNGMPLPRADRKIYSSVRDSFASLKQPSKPVLQAPFLTIGRQLLGLSAPDKGHIATALAMIFTPQAADRVDPDVVHGGGLGTCEAIFRQTANQIRPDC